MIDIYLKAIYVLFKAKKYKDYMCGRIEFGPYVDFTIKIRALR